MANELMYSGALERKPVSGFGCPEPVDIVRNRDIVAHRILLPVQRRLIPFARAGPSACFPCAPGSLDVSRTFDLNKWPICLVHLSALSLYRQLHALCVPFGHASELHILDATQQGEALQTKHELLRVPLTAAVM
jgi:hypothetical protein